VSWMEPWITVNSPLGPIHIDKVDEDYIEENINPDFVEGDNWLHDQRQTEHPKCIPDHHIFIASGLWKIGMLKVMKIFVHEYSEVLAEGLKGAKYNQAHYDVANPSETKTGKILRGEE